MMLSKNSKIQATIYTKNISKKLELDVKKYNEQYNNLVLKQFNLSHDRFLFIDDEIYHIGASLKDLGKKWVAFNKMDKTALPLLNKLVLHNSNK